MRQVPLDFDSAQRTGAIRFARLLSDVLSPPAVLSAAGLVMGWLDHPSITGLLWGAFYGVMASLLPVLFVVYLYRIGRVSDIHMSSPSERHIPYLIGLGGAAVSWLVLRTFTDSPLLQGLVLCHIVLMIGLAVMNTIRLVSAHVASLTAIAGYVGAAVSSMSGWYLLPVVALMFYIRYYLKRHTVLELVAGLLIGTTTVFLLQAAGVFSGS